MSLKFIPNKFKTREMCDDAVYENPRCLKFVPDNLKTQEILHRNIC